MKTHSLRRSIAASRAHLIGALALLGLASSGCSSSAEEPPHNLGNTADNLEADQPLATLQDFAGAWVGEAEDPLALVSGDEPSIYRFPSGSSQIRLELAPGQPGTISFGAAEPPPPPTNFDVGYPEGLNYLSDALFEATVLPPVEGFRYTLEAQYGIMLLPAEYIDDLSVQDGVLRLYYRQNEVFREWCSTQVPHLDSYTGLYTCAAAADGTVGTGAGVGGEDSRHCSISYVEFPGDDDGARPPEPIDCGRLYLCAHPQAPICECYEQGCRINAASSVPGLFLRAHGDELVGAFAKSNFFDAGGGLTSVGTVRFHRVQ
jgi:hypothetical protein